MPRVQCAWVRRGLCSDNSVLSDCDGLKLDVPREYLEAERALNIWESVGQSNV